MARALGHALPGVTQEELDRKAAEDQCLAQEGMVKLKMVQDVSYKHIEELTREDRQARIAAESEEVEWLMSRLRLRNPAHLPPTFQRGLSDRGCIPFFGPVGTRL